MTERPGASPILQLQGREDVKPLDLRLLRYARRTAVHIGVLAGLGTVTAMLVIAQAQLLAGVISGVFLHGLRLPQLAGTFTALGLVLAGRALVAWATEASSYPPSPASKSPLRPPPITPPVDP